MMTTVADMNVSLLPVLNLLHESCAPTELGP